MKKLTDFESAVNILTEFVKENGCPNCGEPWNWTLAWSLDFTKNMPLLTCQKCCDFIVDWKSVAESRARLIDNLESQISNLKKS